MRHAPAATAPSGGDQRADIYLPPIRARVCENTLLTGNISSPNAPESFCALCMPASEHPVPAPAYSYRCDRASRRHFR